VAVGFLRKWFGTGRPASKEVEEAQAELERLAKERPTLQGPARVLRDLLPLCLPDQNLTHSLTLDRDSTQAKLVEGVPLLRNESLVIDARVFKDCWLEICKIVGHHQEGQEARDLGHAQRQDRLDPQELVNAVLTGQPETLLHFWESNNVDPSLAAMVLRMTLFPLFTSISQAMLPLREGVAWQRGYCPTCGSWPLLGEYRGLDQTRFLRCGLCAASWEAARLYCPFCGTRDHEQLGYLQVEGEETSYKAATCSQCQGYVKMLSTLTALPPLALLVADVATMHLDLIAAERGFCV
jgi:FdhE protein